MAGISIPNGAVLSEFRPCIIPNDGLKTTMCLFEDVPYVAVPFYKDENGKPIHHYVDQLLATDDRRVVGMQVWVGPKS